jgi:hypothetical protein
MKIDTEIRHVTKRGENLFLQLGLTPAEAETLKDAVQTLAGIKLDTQLKTVQPAAEPTKKTRK